MKLNLERFFIIFIISCTCSFAQVGIGTVTPDGVLDLNSDEEKNASGSNTYGLVLPRVSLSRTDEAAPIVDPDPSAPAGTLPIGTVVYNTATTSFGAFSVYPGIYMWDGVDWINEFPKKNAEIFQQDMSNFFPTTTTGTYVPITGLENRTFTPAYTGTFKIEVSVNWGGGQLENLGNGTDVAVQSGIFKLEFSGDPDRLYPHHTWSGRHGAGTQYYLIWEQATYIFYKELVANTPYTFSLLFDQTVSDGFINNGNSGDGLGYVGYDIPCTIEFVYLD